MKKILVPTDFSIPADYAIQYAAKFAKAVHASIVLYHVFIPFESTYYTAEENLKGNIETENNLRNRLSAIREEILKSNKDISISIYVDKGPESIRLVEYSKQKKIDLIVMGTTGASGLKEVLIGSFTADIINSALCPVLAIPKGFRFKIPKKITFASDYHKTDIKAIGLIAEWNRSFKSKLNILHIAASDHSKTFEEKVFSDFKRKVEKRFEGVPISFQLIEGADISKAISETTLNDKTDILALSPSKNEGFWKNLFHKSITKTAAYRIRLPLLTIPRK